jgi:general secretion pathway protein K
MRSSGEAGYALVAAVAATALFATFSVAILAWTQRALLGGTAEIRAAQAGAAADAALPLALDALMTDDPARRWPIGDRVHPLRYGPADIRVRIVDERGKVPLNLLDERTAQALLEVGGLSGERLGVARDSLLDWLDDDDEPRPEGAEIGYYRRAGIQPRNGAVQSIDELGRVRGFDPALVARLRPLVTADFGGGSFNPGTAQPLAIAVMEGSGQVTAATIARQREAAGQVTALGFDAGKALIARPLTVEISATIGADTRAVRRCIVELTGNRARPFTIRGCG